MSILIKDATAITREGKAKKCDVLIEGNTISRASPGINASAEHKINASGKLLLPGFANTHAHTAMSLLRGYADDMELHKWLKERIWPVEKKMNAQSVHAGAMLGICEMIKSGTTSFSDMYFQMDSVAKAVSDSGMRSMLGYGMVDLGDEGKREKELKEGERFAREWNGKEEGRISTCIAPHSPITCSSELLQSSAQIANKLNCKIHLHLSETREELFQIMQKTNKRPVDYLDSLGFLSPRVLAAHCVWISAQEAVLLGKKGVSISHCPVSNMKLAGGGAAPLPELMGAGCTISLGTDGAASNNSLSMFEEMKSCSLLQKHARWDAEVIKAQEAFAFATKGGAKALGINAGEITPGKLADLILLDAKAVNLQPAHNLISNIVYSAHAGNVMDVIIDGKLIMQERKILSFDEEKVIEKAENEAEKIC
ncbi:hypothetical protein AUJ17_02615 [Candidatus Micrarchaeota archaeon CG1_02_47_40]|nr:MAG: hypothetical protein AUJ17_02615 [Candidatus Micrarchaeota archaeon CG1_02_47_40]